MSDTGDPDRPPLQCTFPQSYLAASTYAAEGTMVALYGRSVSGEGQHVDVSAQATITWFISEIIPFWVTVGELIKRSGPRWTRARGLRTSIIWPCSNGYISYVFIGSQAGAEVNIKMTKWLEEEGFVTEEIKAMDWYQFDYGRQTQETLDSLLEPIGKLFLSHTIEELYDEAVKRVIPLYPVADSKYTLENAQLESRDFWIKLRHEELDGDITYPGPFAVFSETPIKMKRRAPIIGEHNEEIYVKELGFAQEELVTLRGAGII